MTITAEMIKELRKATDAPLVDCKKTLVEADGDIGKAINLLKKQGFVRYDENGFDAEWLHGDTGTRFDKYGFNKNGSIHKDTKLSIDENGYNRKYYKNLEIEKAKQEFISMSLDKLNIIDVSELSQVFKAALERVILEKTKEEANKDFQSQLQSDDINPMISNLREGYSSALSVIDDEIKELFNAGKDMTALMQINKQLSIINDIYDIAKNLYSVIYRSSNSLEYYDSDKKDIKRLPMISFFKDGIASPGDFNRSLSLLKENASNYTDENDNFESDKLYSDVVTLMLNEFGYANEHWYLKTSFVNELEYMLDFLKVFIEIDYMPISDELENDSEKQDRYIPKDVKISVWRRDQGKCVECGSKEKLEYDHIIPVSKGGSNTERNVQLLCEKCNRQKSATIQ